MAGTRALLIGFGSIGQRHARLLEAEGVAVEVVTAREVDTQHPTHPSIERALAATAAFDYCVVASATERHAADVAQLARHGFAGAVLVEKPVLAATAERPPVDGFSRVGVGYNLRFHPAVAWLREALGSEPALVVDVSAQSFLPDWRPGRDHRRTASASPSGGGVVRDLSHEIDLMLWLFGAVLDCSARGGSLGGLGIDVETACSAVLTLERAPIATLRLAYLDRLPERRLRVTTAADTLEADLLTGRCRTTAGERRLEVDWDETYRRLHRAMLAGDDDVVCSLEEGIEVVRAIERIEASIGHRPAASAAILGA